MKTNQGSSLWIASRVGILIVFCIMPMIRAVIVVRWHLGHDKYVDLLRTGNDFGYSNNFVQMELYWKLTEEEKDKQMKAGNW